MMVGRRRKVFATERMGSEICVLTNQQEEKDGRPRLVVSG